MRQYLYKVLWICFLINNFSHVNGSDEQCGVDNAGGRIRGGEKTTIHHFPWTVSLRGFFYTGQFICSGTIISRQWVVTAAHCIGQNPWYVSPGRTNSYSGLGNRWKIKHYHIHPSFKQTLNKDGKLVSSRDDIA